MDASSSGTHAELIIQSSWDNTDFPSLKISAFLPVRWFIKTLFAFDLDRVLAADFSLDGIGGVGVSRRERATKSIRIKTKDLNILSPNMLI